MFQTKFVITLFFNSTQQMKGFQKMKETKHNNNKCRRPPLPLPPPPPKKKKTSSEQQQEQRQKTNTGHYVPNYMDTASWFMQLTI